MATFSPGAAAAGLGIPDLGAASLGQGGATVASPDDFAALYFNPAGFAGQGGVRVQVDPRVVFHRVQFQRLDASGGNSEGFALVAGGETLAPTSFAPLGGVSVHFDAALPFTVALGGHPLSGATGYSYPDPDSVRASLGPNATGAQLAQLTPQRYSCVLSASKVFVGAAALAVRVAPFLDVGVALQLATAQFSSQLAVASGVAAGEDPALDAELKIAARDVARPSALFGFSARLARGLVAGAALQLPTTFHAAGSLTALPSPELNALGAKLQGDRAQLSFTLPWIARAGVRLARDAAELELAGTYEAWSQLRDIAVAPQGVAVVLGGQSHPLPDLTLHKDLQDAWSARLGGLVRLGVLWPALGDAVLRAGVLHESSAVPSARQSIDLMAWDRTSANLGFSLAVGRYTLGVAAAHFFQADRHVRDSTVLQVVALPGTAAPTVVGNGDYASQLDLVAVSLAAQWGAGR